MQPVNPFRFLIQLFFTLVILCVLFSSTILDSQPKPVFAQAMNTKASTQNQSFNDVSMDSSSPGAFSKSWPANAVSGAGTSLTLTWLASSGAVSYQYCYDTTNDNACSASWISTGTALKAYPAGLSYNTTYYWQVRAVNPSGTTYADANTWWSFKTKVAPRERSSRAGQPMLSPGLAPA